MKEYPIDAPVEYKEGVARRSFKLSLKEKLHILFSKELVVSYYSQDAWDNALEEMLKDEKE